MIQSLYILLLFFSNYFLTFTQHLLDYNDRPDLGHEDRDMLIEDLVAFLNYFYST